MVQNSGNSGETPPIISGRISQNTGEVAAPVAVKADNSISN